MAVAEDVAEGVAMETDSVAMTAGHFPSGIPCLRLLSGPHPCGTS